MRAWSCVRFEALRVVALLLLSIASAHAMAADAFPSRPISVVVPFPAGGAADLVTRVVAERVSQLLGQPIVVLPKPGGNSNIGTLDVRNAAADGYTWLMVAPPFATNPSLQPGLWDPVADFVGVGVVAAVPNLIAVPATFTGRSLHDFVDEAKRHPGRFNYGNPAMGSTQHLNAELFERTAGIELVGVAYKGQPQVAMDLMRGDLGIAFLSAGVCAPYVKSGKLKALAATGTRRLRDFPEVPTMAELGYGDASLVPWYGFAVPGRTPDPVVRRIHEALARAMESPDVQSRLRDIGTEPEPPRTLAEIGTLIRDDTARYGDVVRKAHIRLD